MQQDGCNKTCGNSFAQLQLRREVAMAEERSDILMSDKDYSAFFCDPVLTEKYPDVKLPAPTYLAHEGKILSFESSERISVAFPVSESQTNPVGTLQGGILSSFFDDAFGCLCFASLRKPCVTIDMTVNFIRPVKPGSFVVIHAAFKARGKKLPQVSAEAVNDNEKLVATAKSNWMVYGS
jgi:uncharacterized protein (TIGR00369 family)